MHVLLSKGQAGQNINSPQPRTSLFRGLCTSMSLKLLQISSYVTLGLLNDDPALQNAFKRRRKKSFLSDIMQGGHAIACTPHPLPHTASAPPKSLRTAKIIACHQNPCALPKSSRAAKILAPRNGDLRYHIPFTSLGE